jgi:hypothetical protein
MAGDRKAAILKAQESESRLDVERQEEEANGRQKAFEVSAWLISRLSVVSGDG